MSAPGERRTVGGVEMMGVSTLAVMVGVATDEVRAELERQGLVGGVIGPFSMPQAWARQGRRRAKEAAAATGSSEFEDVLAYWLKREGALNE